MKIFLTILFLSLTINVLDLKAMHSPAQITSQSKKTEGPTTIYEALLSRSEQPQDQFTCTISYNSETNAYSGTRFNNGCSSAEWHSQQIPAGEAQSYYQTLLDQERH